MWIKDLKFNYFRNSDHREFQFQNKKNLIIGDNGSGKTSLLEAIYLLCLGKSFRSKRDINLINLKYKEALVQGTFIVHNDEHSIQVRISDKKMIKIDEKSIRKISQLIGLIQIILFTERDIDLIEQGPEKRRRFMDLIFSQLNKDYLITLLKYNKTIEERNQYLKSDIKDNTLLDSYNQSLVNYGSKIVQWRCEYFSVFLTHVEKIMNRFQLSCFSDLHIKYHCDLGDNTVEENNIEKISKRFHNQISQSKSREDRLRYTVKGPHRDDILFLKAKENRFIEYSSAGERRMLSILLKIAEANFLYELKKDWPILLLDDILLELDEKNSNLLMDYINSSEHQVFITTTEIGLYQKIKDYELTEL